MNVGMTREDRGEKVKILIKKKKTGWNECREERHYSRVLRSSDFKTGLGLTCWYKAQS